MKRPPAAIAPLRLMCLLLTALILLAPALLPAQNLSDREIREMDWGGGGNGAPVEGDGEGLNTGLMLARMLGALALVVALIAVVAWLMRRYLPGSARGAAGQAGGIRVVATRMLGNRSSLMLVRVRGRTLLLGVTPQSIQTLTEIEELEGEWARPSSAEESAEDGPPASSPFQKQLGKFVNQRVDEERD